MSDNTTNSSNNGQGQKALEGKVAIVTGASRGLGAAMAKQLAADGAKVAVNYLNSAEAAEAVVEEIKKAGGDAHAFKADVAVRDQVFALVDQVIQRWGRLDVFVNNSGIARGGPLEKAGEEEVSLIFETNFKGTLWGLQAAAPVLQSGGSIINLSSVLATRINPGLGIYGASKVAVDHLTKTAAKELGPRGIRVNAVAPGAIPTDMSRALPLEQIKQQTPLQKRLGTPEEVANVVAFLASPAASWVTGEIITLAGGLDSSTFFPI